MMTELEIESAMMEHQRMFHQKLEENCLPPSIARTAMSAYGKFEAEVLMAVALAPDSPLKAEIEKSLKRLAQTFCPELKGTDESK